MSIPNIKYVVKSFGIEYVRADVDCLEGSIATALDYDGPIVCEVFCRNGRRLFPQCKVEKILTARLVHRL